MLEFLDFSHIYVTFIVTIWRKKVQTPKFDRFTPFFGPGNPILGGKENKKVLEWKKLFTEKYL